MLPLDVMVNEYIIFAIKISKLQSIKCMYQRPVRNSSIDDQKSMICSKG